MIDRLIEILQKNIETELKNKANGLENNVDYAYINTIKRVINSAKNIKKEHEEMVNISLKNVDYPDEQGWYFCHTDAPLGVYQQIDTEVEDSFQAVYVIDGYVNIAGFKNGTLLEDFIDMNKPLRWIKVINDLFPKTMNNLPSKHGYYFVYQNGLKENGMMVLYIPYTKTYQMFGSELVYPAESLIDFVWEQISLDGLFEW